MAILKCKMCGGDLKVDSGSTIVECEYCGTSQTVPSADSEKKTNLFNRANELRIKCEFDKASGVYESIVAEFPAEPEAYWGLCLCKYGIEYVDDTVTGRKIPTCHRTSYESIFEDSNFERACEYADSVMVSMYRDEAKEIDRIQKRILEISSKEEPFDIFICYKESDEKGERTIDSTLAQDMYEALTAKGYKVFFARITLEDKLGREYEPYIFSALNSAKVMLAVGTKFEYFNAVWVKNEWSRFLDLMKKDREKLLIPCYKDIDAYDMPPEFKNLQAQDMGKIGFMQDLIRGIGKVITLKSAASQHTASVNAAPVVNVATIDSLLKRVFMYLEDGDWKSADEYCEKVLDINPEYAKAYLGKLMATFQLRSYSAISEEKRRLTENQSYIKFMRYADPALKNELKPYFEKAEISNKEFNYKTAWDKMNGKSINQQLVAADLFTQLKGYKDSEELAEKCREKAEQLRREEKEESDRLEREKQEAEEQRAREEAAAAREQRKAALVGQLSKLKEKRKEHTDNIKLMSKFRYLGAPGKHLRQYLTGIILFVVSFVILLVYTQSSSYSTDVIGVLGIIVSISSLITFIATARAIFTTFSNRGFIALLLVVFLSVPAGFICIIKNYAYVKGVQKQNLKSERENLNNINKTISECESELSKLNA